MPNADSAQFFQFIGEENQEKRRAQRSFDRAQRSCPFPCRQALRREDRSPIRDAQHYGGPAENGGARRQNEDASLASRLQIYRVHSVREEYLGGHKPHSRQ